MNKQLRAEIFAKYDGHCAYCGKTLENLTRMEVDHIAPVFRGRSGDRQRLGTATIDDLNPACKRCNRYKTTMSVEGFRKEIAKQVDRARRQSLNDRLAEDFGLVVATGKPVTFYFEESSHAH